MYRNLIKDYYEKISEEGSVEVYFTEPEYPYHFEFEPIFCGYRERNFFDNLLTPDFLKQPKCIGGRMQVHQKKSGRPVILDVEVEVYDDGIWIEPTRNEFDWHKDIVNTFVDLCLAKAEVVKSEKNMFHGTKQLLGMKDYKSPKELRMLYEEARSKAKKVWNEHMKPSSDE